MNNFNVLCFSLFFILLCWPYATFIIRIVKTYNRYLKYIIVWEIDDIPLHVRTTSLNIIILITHTEALWIFMVPLSKGFFFFFYTFWAPIYPGRITENYLFWKNWTTIAKTLRVLCSILSLLEVKWSESCSVVSDSLWPMDYTLPGFSVHEILQARILRWVAVPFSSGSSQPSNQTQISHTAGRFFTVWATREDLFSFFLKVASVVSDSVRSHRRQPTRLPHPWDSPGKNTGVGCHCLLHCVKVKSESEVVQLRLTCSDSMDCSLTGSSIHGIF